jgi:squalene synthase HpnC
MSGALPTRSMADQLRVKERAENFPVALLALPPAYRRDLRAIYDVVRVIDDLGDAADGDRTALLHEFAADLARVWRGAEPRQVPARRLVPVVARRGLSRRPFERLVEANLMDQRVSSYRTFDDLLDYCSLSASPVGHLVLEVFGQSTARTRELSDRVCISLQLIEHWQDIAEDRRAGRTYLPQEDMERYEVLPADLDATTTAPALRRLVHFETDRASAMAESGATLVGELHGWARLAVAGYVAGGRAAVDALRRADGDVMAGPPRPRRRDVVHHLLGELWRSSR